MAQRLVSFVSMSLLILAFLIVPVQTMGAKIKDSESATHGDEAASYQVVDTYKFPGFKVVQFNLAVLSHYSYMLISENQAIVVDPGRDPFAYLDMAKKEGAAIKGVFLTHSHADFVAGHIEVARMAGCPIYKIATGGAQFTYKALKEGDTLEVGNAVMKFVETPGHTPDGLCGFVYSKSEPVPVQVIFTGDTLFVGSIGRPDLLEGTMSAASLASMSFDTWNNKLSKVNDSAVILPAHGAGSLCGAHLSDSPSSTIGAEKASNHYLKYKNRADFIAAVLEGLPEAPQYFRHNAAMNRRGPDPVDWKAPVGPEATPDKTLMDPSKVYVADIRDAAAFARGHIPNSVNIGLRGRFESWLGTMVPWGENLVLCGDPDELEEALYRLHRVGYRARVITMDKWIKAGMPVAASQMVQPAELYALMQKGDGPIIVDVRLPNEWMGLRIGTVVNLPLTHLHELASKLDPNQPTVAVCNSAYRSSMAVGILQRRGFKNVSSLAGGSEAWIKAGLPVYGSEIKKEVTAAAKAGPKRDIGLPERMSPSTLKQLLVDLPGTFDLIDIRPPDQFADFNIPGSTNVDLADAISSPAYLTGVGPLIIVDRDGSLAMAVAGILSQKTQRPIKVLHGGLEAYWEESELRRAVREVPLGGGVSPPPMKESPASRFERVKPSTETQPPPAAPERPAVPKTKSAGC